MVFDGSEKCNRWLSLVHVLQSLCVKESILTDLELLLREC